MAQNNKKDETKDPDPVSENSPQSRPSYLLREKVNVNPFVPLVSPELPLFITITIYGKRKSGKSVFLRWLLSFYRSYLPWIWVFTKTKQNCFYEAFIPSKSIIPNFNSTRLRQIMDSQVKALSVHLQNPDFNPRIGVCWDDYNGNDITYNDVLRDYYYTGRHFLSQNYFSAQHITLTPPAIRSNTDVAVLFNTDYRDALDHYWRDFAGKMDRNEFIDLFVRYCERVPHGFLMVVTDAPYDQKFYHGVADILPINLDWICCCEEAWRENEQQLKEIKDGTMQFRIDQINALSDPGDIPAKGKDDGRGFRPAWELPKYEKEKTQMFEVTPNRKI